MIYIEERTPKKVPGFTSLFISFSYNQEIINKIQSLEVFNYDKASFEFEIPLLELASFIDSICEIDDIELTMLQDSLEEAPLQRKCTYKIPALDYQLEGIDFGLKHKKFLLLDEPGLGKTKQIIHIAEELHASGKVEHCLVVCGVNSLKSNWKSEIEKHSNLSSVILGQKQTKSGRFVVGSIKDRVNHLKSKIDEFFIVTNIETIRSDEIVNAILKGANKFNMIVVDEIHCAKSSQSQQGKNLLKLNKAEFLVGATGTLIMNNPIDSYLPLKWIGAEKSGLTKFKAYYCHFSGPFHNIICGFKHLDSLKQQIDHFSLRRLKDKVKLPPKTIINELVDMGESQQKFYDNIVDGVVDEVDKVQINKTSLLALVSRLRQALSLIHI